MANKWGGSRPNSGRPTKAFEQQLIEDLDSIIDRKKAIRVLWEQMEQGNMRAMTIYFDRRFGKAKPIAENELDERQFQIEIIDKREEVFKDLLGKIKYEGE